MKEKDGAVGPIDCQMHNAYIIVDPEKVKIVCQEMLLESSVEVLLSAPVVNAIVENDLVFCCKKRIIMFITKTESDVPSNVGDSFASNLIKKHGGNQ